MVKTKKIKNKDVPKAYLAVTNATNLLTKEKTTPDLNGVELMIHGTLEADALKLEGKTVKGTGYIYRQQTLNITKLEELKPENADKAPKNADAAKQPVKKTP